MQDLKGLLRGLCGRGVRQTPQRYTTLPPAIVNFLVLRMIAMIFRHTSTEQVSFANPRNK